MKKNIKKILVVAAHPDDEILGCGGTLIKMRKAGYKIKCIFISDGESSRNIKDKKKLLNIIEEREKQAVQVSKLLKFDKPSFFRLPDNKLDTVPLIKIIRIIENHPEDSNVKVCGLMGITENNISEVERAMQFDQCNNLYNQIRAITKNVEILSMGMSNDWEDAVKHGSTMIRIGTKIFGERK